LSHVRTYYRRMEQSGLGRERQKRRKTEEEASRQATLNLIKKKSTSKRGAFFIFADSSDAECALLLHQSRKFAHQRLANLRRWRTVGRVVLNGGDSLVNGGGAGGNGAGLLHHGVIGNSRIDFHKEADEVRTVGQRYALMETFMRAVQKLVVRDVSDYAARRIAATKEVTNPTLQ